MARNGKEKSQKEPRKLKLKQPDRSGPSEATLLDMAQKRGLFDIQQKGDETKVDEDPLVGRVGESMLWSTSLTMLHFTLDVLVSNQYAQEIEWGAIIRRAAQAFPIILLFFYSFHPHPATSLIFPNFLPARIQPLLHQLFFFTSSISAGIYLIHLTNTSNMYANLKQAPPLGCLWIWSVIELNVFWATGSLIICGIFLKANGYSIM
ncbi:hypothetical protein BGZ60DRAFT_373997 [Tricladium varicosporioides]|nr:hypothetical protein BGZ60DRAFT_373997 [Hymenoscyphus varicosporioides]